MITNTTYVFLYQAASRRNSESVFHGAVAIAAAVPQLMVHPGNSMSIHVQHSGMLDVDMELPGRTISWGTAAAIATAP